MKIGKITLHNFRIYQGTNTVQFSDAKTGNLTIIAGKNGYGKTTFLTSLVWVFYGKLMSQVEEKYRKDIKSADGYENYLISTFNKTARNEFEKGDSINSTFYVEIDLTDILIPSIPCRTVKIKRSFDLNTKKEELLLLIDGDENELTKEVGYEIFINDFILPREIAKFFFFDAEKIVSLAEAKSKSELRNLSRAYSEVLGIKKYEELKKNLELLLAKLRRNGVSEVEETRLIELIKKHDELNGLLDYNQEKQDKVDFKINALKTSDDDLQEKLIREGNSITLEELQSLKNRRDKLFVQAKDVKKELKKMFELAPLVIAGKHLNRLNNQLILESKLKNKQIEPNLINEEIKIFSNNLFEKINKLNLDEFVKDQLEKSLRDTVEENLKTELRTVQNPKILLDFSDDKVREFQEVLNNIRTSYTVKFQKAVQEDKNIKVLLSSTNRKIKEAEARKDNPLAKKIREEKSLGRAELETLLQRKSKLVEEFAVLNHDMARNAAVKSEFEKNFKLKATDKKKFEVTEKLLDKINQVIIKIKQEKKYSLQKSISLGLKRLMHKNNFITDVKVNIRDEVMEIDLIDEQGDIIEKESLSKGEQQLYATALLKALVDESGIKFPVFIDSPLQKFDKFHSENIIKEFYPTISDQVVLFPLLEKELSEKEFELLRPNLSQAILINNSHTGSVFQEIQANKLFNQLKEA